jgi:hypothetical protein
MTPNGVQETDAAISSCVLARRVQKGISGIIIMKKLALALTLLSALPVLSARADSPETPHLAFVKLYIEQLEAIEDIRDAAAKELKTVPDTQRVADCVHTMTQYQLELSTQISAMQDVRLNKLLDWLPGSLVDYNKQKLDLYKQYGDGCATMLAGPKPGVDYGKITASLPTIRAQVEFIDKGIFKTAPAVFGSLIEMKGNSHGGADHLIITKAERDDLVHQIKLAFGDKLNQHDQNWIVSAASVLDFYLEKKGYKSSDEPWD